MERRDFLWLVTGSAASTQLACAKKAPREIRPEPAHYEHPPSEQELTELVDRARTGNLKIRVRGSAHSVADAIYTDPVSDGGQPSADLNIMLDKLRAVRFDDDKMQVTVEAGCHLGVDPKDPTRTSKLENSFFSQLDRHGWALPDMGGIIHQSVGGFLSAGSAGGSLQHSIYDSIVGIRLVDGTGTVRELHRPSPEGSNPDDPFFAAGISMGLLGIVTAVTFQCCRKYHVKGTEVVRGVTDPEAPFKPFDAGSDSLEDYLRRKEHARILWYPQKEVKKMQVWEAKKMELEECGEERGPPDDYEQQPFVFLTPDEQNLARGFFEKFDALNPPDPDDDFLLPGLYALASNLFLDTNEVKEFQDEWWKALPMDNGVDDDVLPMEFTEAWIPVSHTRDVMVALRDHYEANRWTATGVNACEIYAAKASPFWMSPAYQQDVLRIDLFWFKDSASAPEVVYYPQFWELLDRFEPRYHWGKHFPTQPAVLHARYGMTSCSYGRSSILTRCS